ncbi:hypothetical protein [Escherichia coli]|uniref:hypothetical protein n=1 Tax=Escherichia coli TaxID=562 RepID=UPI000BE9A5EE|nr:hypothetical protein [Escherichia coli]
MKTQLNNNKNAQELPARLTTEQLINAMRQAAKYLPEDTAKLINHAAARLGASMAATRQACEERTAALNTIEKIREISFCPDEIDVQVWVKNMVCGEAA